MRVAAAQYALTPVAGVDAFARRCEDVVLQAKELSPELLVLPEYLGAQVLSAGGGTPNIRDLPAAAERYRALFAGLARTHSMAILAGTTIVADGNQLRNAAHLFHPDGRVDVQPKLHLTPTERDWGLAPGDQLKLVEVGGRKAAILVCYDIEFPELARMARAQGAEIILCPSSTEDRHGFHRVRYTAHARAIEDQVYVVVAMTVGGMPAVEGLRMSVGQAAIIGPCDYPFPPGGILAEGEFNFDMLVAADLDMAAIARAQSGGSVRTWQDRRPDLYARGTAG
ncbi:MAG: carbon-nitrogen hydrolase family protein [Alphaproteobacteria bacterium]|nr:carbon-nitrogen hydrolase family protein [Alphaproteobacteria bacterium]